MAQETAKSGVSYTQFGGLATNSDPRDIGLGAVRMENMTLSIPGQLTSRKGHTAVTFLNEQAAGDATVTGLYRFETPSRKFVVFTTSDGAIRAGRDASL